MIIDKKKHLKKYLRRKHFYLLLRVGDTIHIKGKKQTPKTNTFALRKKHQKN